MKTKIIGILTVLLFYPLAGQQAVGLSYNGGMLSAGGPGLKVDSPNYKRGLTYDEIQGTPYPDNFFYEANFIVSDKNKSESAPARYNAYSDQIEFKKGEEILALFPDSPYTRIELIPTNQVLVKLNIDDELKGYFYELVNGKSSLYKKVKAKFNDFVPAANSYAMDRAANFNILSPTYYIKTENAVLRNPKNKKDILENYPDKKDALTIFFKENKIKFDKEEDLKRLVTFLNQ